MYILTNSCYNKGMKTITLCQSCEKNPATHKRPMYGDVHCADCIVYGGELQGIFEPILEVIK